jgi:hypothetical protein
LAREVFPYFTGQHVSVSAFQRLACNAFQLLPEQVSAFAPVISAFAINYQLQNHQPLPASQPSTPQPSTTLSSFSVCALNYQLPNHQLP